MSTETKRSLEDIIDELHREAATALAELAYQKEQFPWRKDVQPGGVYEKRAEAALAAVAHLVGAMN